MPIEPNDEAFSSPVALEPVAAAPPPADEPPPVIAASLAPSSCLSATSGPTGNSAARARVSLRSWLRNSLHPSHERTCWRTGPDTFLRPSAASASSSWTSPQVSRRALLDSASVIRARTRSDLMLGTVVPIAWAISS